jgi:LDH2 family malate/lactate/ureidoglycolate dehydrogenase
MAGMPVIAADELLALGRQIFLGVGTPPDNAEQVAASLVGANLAGHDSHGVIRIPTYVELIHQGRLDPAARPSLLRQSRAIAVVDGQWAFGQLTARFAMRLAIEQAQTNGVGAVSAVNCNHIGRLGEWVEQAAAEATIGFATVSFYGPGAGAAAPHGAAEPIMSTNPVAFGLPGGRHGTVVADFATTVVAEGKLQVARAKGAPAPEGSILDAHGNPSTNPDDFYAGGALLPFAGHKGYGLSVVSELLSLAVGGAFARRQPQTESTSGAFFLCVDPAAFGALEDYTAASESLLGRIKAARPAPGVPEVLLPGEPEQRAREQRTRQGIAIDDTTWSRLQALRPSTV